MKLNFNEQHQNQQLTGYLIDHPQFIAFFGSRNIVNIDKYLNKPVHYVKQTHSILVHETEAISLQHPSKEGDAHFTKDHTIAVGIVTADCMPILIYSKADNMVAAIHAGWRGLLNGVIESTFQKCHFENTRQLIIMIGPHIGKDSFIVQEDVIQLFMDAGHKNEVCISSKQTTIDLQKIALKKLLSLGCDTQNITALEIDTVKDHQFFSFRREKKTGLRNYSAIALK